MRQRGQGRAMRSKNHMLSRPRQRARLAPTGGATTTRRGHLLPQRVASARQQQLLAADTTGRGCPGWALRVGARGVVGVVFFHYYEGAAHAWPMRMRGFPPAPRTFVAWAPATYVTGAVFPAAPAASVATATMPFQIDAEAEELIMLLHVPVVGFRLAGLASYLE